MRGYGSTQAGRLALELNVPEDALFQWLKRCGFAEVSEGTWISGHLVQSAHAYFSRRAHLIQRELKIKAEVGYNKTSASNTQVDDGSHTNTINPFAHFLKENNLHAQADKASRDAQADPISPKSQKTKLPRPLSQPLIAGRGDERLERRVQHLEAQLRMVQEELNQNKRTNEGLLTERSQLKQEVRRLLDEHQTLDQTFNEVSLELQQNKTEVQALHDQLRAQEHLDRSLDEVNQQKQAWRARALELEERVQSGQKLPNQLKELGLKTFEEQTQLFRTLLGRQESASLLFNAIDMVNRNLIQKVVQRWVTSACAHPLCNQIVRLRGQLAIRVEREEECEICAGDSQQRWFNRFVVASEHAHLRRFLLIGGPTALHQKIRRLMEGQNVDFRLIADGEVSSENRALSRLESADLLFTWSPTICPVECSEPYEKMARVAQCPHLKISGDQAELAALARQTIHFISRTGGALST